MFTQPVSSPPPGPQTPSTISPSRTSRLRGLSYIRNYTQSHILSRDPSNAQSASASSTRHTGGNLTRSASYTPSSTISHNNSSSSSSSSPANSHRLSLINGSQDPNATLPRSTPRSLATNTTNPDVIPEVSEPNTPITGPSSSAAENALSTSNPTPAMRMPTSQSVSAGLSSASESMPSIRFSAYYDPRSTRPSLNFSPISRTLPNGNEVIRVGRYSERDSQSMANLHGHQPSAAPVGFKSKVVSRRHCEFWCEDGKWYIKDVKSSSGTFLNHIRLSAPSSESKAYPVNDGDIVQLGIDFKGGEENIFRCVKMRLELNRGWQNKPNNFNMAAHKRLRTMAAHNSSLSNSSSQDCSICLNAIAPCQSLFVSPCSHTWHFKCIKSLLNSPQYPNFVCPNCRAAVDLEDDVEEPSEEWQALDEQEEPLPLQPTTNGAADSDSAAPSPPDAADTTVLDTDAMDVTVNLSVDSPSTRGELPHATSQPLPIRNPASGSGRAARARGTPSPPAPGPEGPITPRNNAGPWVFDGTAGRNPAEPAEMRSLDAAAMDMDPASNEQSDDSAH